MLLRCPCSKFLGFGRIQGYRWIINDRGYANVVETKQSEHEVYGLVYSLTSSDEKSLDQNEGVPFAYTKEMLRAQFWASSDSSQGIKANEAMLVYIDRKRIEPDHPKAEYIYRMNMGIKDAIKEGIPQSYFDENLRQFIPAAGDEEAESLARRQASKFQDET